MAVSGAWGGKIDCNRHKRTFWNDRNILYPDGWVKEVYPFVKIILSRFVNLNVCTLN